MFDVYNHVAVYGLLLVGFFAGNAISNYGDLLEDVFFFAMNCFIGSLMIMIGLEIIAWSIWYLTGGW